MSKDLDPTSEGRLLALRQVVAMLVAGQDCAAILDTLDDAGRDGQEDPGAVPTEAFAIEGALAEERRLLAREIRLRSAGSAPG
jgi:hypothetical protein